MNLQGLERKVIDTITRLERSPRAMELAQGLVKEIFHMINTIKGESTIEMNPGVSSTTHKPFIRYRWGDQITQWSPAEARQHALALLECAEAAESDGAVFLMAQSTLGLSENQAAYMLVELRKFRAGEKKLDE